MGKLRSEASLCIDDPSGGQVPGRELYHLACHSGENPQWEYYP